MKDNVRKYSLVWYWKRVIILKMESRTTVPKTLFSTELFSPRDRLEAYRDSIGAVFDVSNIDLGGEGFHASLESYLLHEIMLVETETVAQNFCRTPSTLARTSLDHVFIQLFFSGFTAFKQNGSHHICDSSSLVVIDTTKPWDAFNPHFHHLTLVIPRRLLQKSLWHYDSHHGRLLKSSNNPFVELLEKLMLSLYKNLDHIRSEEAPNIMSHVLDLVISTLNFSSYSERNKNNKRHEKFLESMMKIQCGISHSAIADLFKAQGLNTFLKEQSLKSAFKRISNLPDPDERYIIQPDISPVIFTSSKTSSPYRLWEEWIVSI